MMKKKLLILYLFCGLISSVYASIPRSEYPRPQFQREDWINLNGEWTFSFDLSNSGQERQFYKSTGFDKKIIVPFAPESSLSGVGFKDFISQMWYHRTITIPQKWEGKKVLLNFGAVYYKAEVYIDGEFVGRHTGGTSSFSIDLTKYVSAGKTHDLVVFVKNDIRGASQTAGKQNLQYQSYGCNYTRTTGIWQTVWLEPVDPNALRSVFIRTDIDQKQILITPDFYVESSNSLKVILRDGKKEIANKTIAANNGRQIILPVNGMKLWSPQLPYLYDIEFQLIDKSGQIIDKVFSYAGMRKIHIDGNKIYLNNKPFYQRLVLDQGFYPDGIWTAPSDEALKKDIEMSMQAGFNGARLHQKVFEERFHYWADKLGYITWGEASSWGMDCNSVETARNFIVEWSETVVRDRNHPSLLIWTPLNEAWWPDKEHFPRLVEDLYLITKNLDPTRPFHDVSGGVHIKTDLWSVHNYEQDAEKLKKQIYDNDKFQETNNWGIKEHSLMNIGFNGLKYTDQYKFPAYDGKMPFLIDEVGGIKWSAQNQQINEQTESWGYGDGPQSIDEFYNRLESQIDTILSLEEYVWGYCYTQLFDVEQEQNGIYYYDRTPKFDMARISKIFRKEPVSLKRK